MNTLNDMALERFSASRFYQTHVTRLSSQAPSKLDNTAGMQLPTNAVVHSANSTKTLLAGNDGLPDGNTWFAVQETSPVWLKVETLPATEASLPLGVKDTFVYRHSALLSGISNFFQHNKRYHRIMTDRLLSTMQNVLTWIDYSPLLEIKFTGALKEYRKFNILFRTILDKVCAIDPKSPITLS